MENQINILKDYDLEKEDCENCEEKIIRNVFFTPLGLMEEIINIKRRLISETF